jgi:hypothetical protein
MKRLLFAFAAASALPLLSVAPAQAPAPIDLETVQPIAGSWGYRTIEGGSEADFVDSAAAVRLQIRCNNTARTVSIVRPGVPAAAPTLAIWTTSVSRSVPARYLATKDLVADIGSADDLLDAIAFSRGRIATAASGAPMIAIGSGPEATRVIEDCRN